ncbi:MAG: hypothetical protein IKK33_09965 [Lachnospiraceae bacterium]|nr:hypothetical protein [Lachnospiraceae bacterium]
MKIENNKKVVVNVIAFFGGLIFYYIATHGTMEMNMASYDAKDIWQTITSFYTDEMYPSYVLYKGINAVYPYVWLYHLAMLFHLNEWFFVKMFYGICFAYVSGVGFPNIVEKLLKNKVSIVPRCIMIVVLWDLWDTSFAFTQLMIDLPCLAYFVLLINLALTLYRNKNNRILFALCGLLCGLCMSASGQYTIPAICVVILLVCCSLKNEKTGIKRFGMAATYLLPCILCIGVVLLCNTNFEKEVVDEARQEGAWIPSGDDWLKSGLVRFRYNYRADRELEISSNRKAAILVEYFGGEEQIPAALTVEEYMAIFFKYPADSIINYLNSFFLILSPDGGAFNAWPLFFFYSMIYLALYEGVKRCDTWKKFFSPLFWVGFAFVWATVPMLVMNIEARTCMQIQGLIAALAICGTTFREGAKKLIETVKECWRSKSLKSLSHIPYPVLLYIIFICVCFVHIATLYDGNAINPSSVLIDF